MNNGKYCLLVDDDPEDQEIFINALQQISSTTGCYAVSNGEEALRILLEDHVNPDYIFTDLQMPVMDGISFLAAMQSIEHLKTIPVIVLSSDLSAMQIENLKHFNVTGMYAKTNEDLLKEILKKYFLQSDKRPTIL